ncbi:hypothetical protein HMPREF0262_01962 [Clostridium sp. ATCC 29733]|nr:hypothetical protein HMPREF0262_01962 [Clostridium sp. ATCC 29733]
MAFGRCFAIIESSCTISPGRSLWGGRRRRPDGPPAHRADTI